MPDDAITPISSAAPDDRPTAPASPGGGASPDDPAPITPAQPDSAPSTPDASPAGDPGTPQEASDADATNTDATDADADASDADTDPAADADDDGGPATTIEQPAKVMRIGTMIKQLLDEVRSAPLDEAARERLAAIHRQSIKELEEGLSPELVDELERLSLPFTDEKAPSESELRVAQAQLVGWLEGLFHGLQTALVAQQMAAQAQLSHMRRELPPGAVIEGRLPPGVMIQRRADDAREHSTGQYL